MENRGSVRVVSLIGTEQYILDGAVNTVEDALIKFLNGEDPNGYTFRVNNELSQDLERRLNDGDVIAVFASEKVAKEGLAGAGA